MIDKEQFVMEQLITIFWPQLIAYGTLVAWLVRMEAGMRENRKEIRRFWSTRKEDRVEATKSRDETNAMLREVRTDIKHLTETVIAAVVK